MAKILLVTPDATLRQAIRLFLFPDHDVFSLAHLGGADAGHLDAQDLWIIGAAATLPEREGFSELIRGLEKRRGPVIWLEEEGVPCPVKGGRIFPLKMPLHRESFHATLKGLLPGADSTAGKGAFPVAPAAAEEKSAPKGPKGSSRRPRDEANPIDLVEVVDPGEPGEKGSKESR